MASNVVDRFRYLHKELRSEIIFDHISTQLLQAEIVNREEFQQIRSLSTDTEKADFLLELLPKKGNQACSNFLTVLDEIYPWLAHSLREEAVQIDNNHKNMENDKLNRVVTPEMMDVVRRNARAIERWTSLAHVLGLTKHVVNIRVRVCVYGEQHDMCLLYLLQEWVGISSKDATLNRLIQALKEEGLNDVADELETTFAQ